MLPGGGGVFERNVGVVLRERADIAGVKVRRRGLAMTVRRTDMMVYDMCALRVGCLAAWFGESAGVMVCVL